MDALLDSANLDLLFLGKLLAAVAAGGLIGLERQVSGKPAGLRTNILICVGSALIVGLGVAASDDLTIGQRVVSDPMRVAAGVITGIGFLGGGVILHSRGSVQGLTTAATIWVVAAIGSALGAGYFEAGAVGTLLTITTLFLIEKLERGTAESHQAISYTCELAADGREELARLWSWTEEHRVDVYGRQVRRVGGKLEVSFNVRAHPDTHRKIDSFLFEHEADVPGTSPEED